MIGLGVGGDKNTLFSFSRSSLSTVTVVPVSGLGASTLVGISFRPLTRQLYGLGVNGNTTSLFAIDPESGATTPVGSQTLPAGVTIVPANVFGFDFQPVADRLRVVDNLPSDSGPNLNNFRLNPNNGAFVAADTDLDFGGLPGNEGEGPLATIAYDRNLLGATATTLFGIVAGGDRLVRLGGVDGTPSPNGGKLTSIGPLGVDVSTNAGLDIDPATGEAFAILQSAGQSGLYGIDLSTGAATPIGKLAGGAFQFGSLAIEPPFLPGDPGPPPQPPSSPPATVQPAPELLSLKLSPTAFVPAKSGGPIATKTTKPPRGTTVSYTLSAAATVTFKVERATVGRKAGKTCVKQTPANRAKKPCRLYKALKPTFTHTGASGANSFRFSGRVGTTAAAPGSYRLIASVGATTRSASFRVLQPRR